MKSQFEPWSPAEKAFLVENAQRFTAEYIALRLGRTTRAVFTRASRMQIPLSTGKRWTPAEVKFLEENAATMKTADIASALGRDRQAVRNKASNLGISLPGNRKYSAEDVELCRALFLEGLHTRSSQRRWKSQPVPSAVSSTDGGAKPLQPSRAKERYETE